jgi:hypothetical protein
LLLLLFVVILPALGTGAGAALLAVAFRKNGRPRALWILGAIVPLLATGALIVVTARGDGYSVVGALYQVIVASAAALVGAVALVLKPPIGRRIAAVLLVTAYPLFLVALILAGPHGLVVV